MQEGLNWRISYKGMRWMVAVVMVAMRRMDEMYGDKMYDGCDG